MEAEADSVKKLLLVLVSSVVLNCQDDFNQRVYTFGKRWGEFLFDYVGCPVGAATVDDCHPKRGHTDRIKFKKSCLSAADLYKFKDKEACNEI